MSLINLGILMVKIGSIVFAALAVIAIIVVIIKQAYSMITDSDYAASEHWYTQLAVFIIALSLIAIIIGICLIAIS